jgi:tRNA A37 N6-isopentenylltransferase MiaA
LQRARRIHAAENRKEHAMQTNKIRRRSNGSIDIDAYLEKAHALWAQAYAQFFTWLGCTAAGCLHRITTAFAAYAHRKRSNFRGHSGLRWCDATERALTHEFMGQHSLHNGKWF